MLVKKTVTPTVTLAAYEASDVVGGAMDFTFESYEKNAYRPIKVKEVIVKDNEVQSEKFYLHLFRRDPDAAASTDADAFNPSANDIEALVASIYIADTDYYERTAYFGLAQVAPDRIIYVDSTLYGVLEAVETPDYAAADDLEVTLILEV